MNLDVTPYGFELARPGEVPLTRRDDIMSSSVGHNSDEGVPTMLSFLRRQTESPRIGQIRLLNLFATLNQRELRIIDGLLHDRHYLKDEVVFDHGEEGQAQKWLRDFGQADK